MKLTLHKENRGIKIAWFFMVITIGAFLNDLKDSLQLINDSNLEFQGENIFKVGYSLGEPLGSKLGMATLLGIGILLYKRTKGRRFNKPVWGPKLIDYILVVILTINFIFPLLSGRWSDGTPDDSLAFFYVTASLLAYGYALLAKPKVSLNANSENKNYHQ